MATYTITANNVEGARKASIEKKLRKAFGKDADIFTVEKDRSPESRQGRLDAILEDVHSNADDVRELHDELEKWKNNLPENLQDSDKAQQLENAMDNLNNLADEIEAIDGDSIEFPGMY